MQPSDNAESLASPMDLFFKPVLFIFCLFSVTALLSMI